MGAHRAAPRGLHELMRDFGRRFVFTTTKMRDHIALTAVRRNQAERGVSVVMTPHVDEMRDALEQDLEDSRAGGLPPAVGPGPAGQAPG